MAIETILGEKIKKGFPKLMKSDDGILVLFIEPGIGTVVNGNASNWIAKHRTDWVMSYFTDHNEPITLVNK